MEDAVKKVISAAKSKMEGPIGRLEKDLSKIRAGKASPTMLEGVMADYYGNPTPISQIANINTPDAKTIIVQPWEKQSLSAIEKGILAANLGFTPINDGSLVRISIPPLSEERRKSLAKQVKSEGENAKVSVRNIRRDLNEDLKALKKDVAEDILKAAEADIQKVTDATIKKVDDIIKAKEDEILKI